MLIVDHRRIVNKWTWKIVNCWCYLIKGMCDGYRKLYLMGMQDETRIQVSTMCHRITEQFLAQYPIRLNWSHLQCEYLVRPTIFFGNNVCIHIYSSGFPKRGTPNHPSRQTISRFKPMATLGYPMFGKPDTRIRIPCHIP